MRTSQLILAWVMATGLGAALGFPDQILGQTPPATPRPSQPPQRSPALDSLRAELDALNRAQAEEVRRILDARQEEFASIREAMRAAADQNASNLEEARRQVEEIRRQNAQIRQGAGASLQEALRERQRLVRGRIEGGDPSLGVQGPLPERPLAPQFRGGTASPEGPFQAGQRFVAGAELTPLNPALARYFGVEAGVLVTAVTPGSPGAEAGLLPGDVIIEVDGVSVRTIPELRQAMGALRPGPQGAGVGAPLGAEGVSMRIVRESGTLDLRLRR